jgi:hypothetical protein
MFSIDSMASGEAHDPGRLLALDIVVDAPHPAWMGWTIGRQTSNDSGIRAVCLT